MADEDLTLRIELFPADADRFVDFYMRVLRFDVVKDERDQPDRYVYLQRGRVFIGALKPWGPTDDATRVPPQGVELVLEVGDVDAERDLVVSAGWPLVEDLTDRPWGLRDFRILDPDGYYLRITNR